MTNGINRQESSLGGGHSFLPKIPLASPYQIGANIDYHAFRGRDMFNISLKGKVAQQVICTTSIPKLYEL